MAGMARSFLGKNMLFVRIICYIGGVKFGALCKAALGEV